MTFEYILMNTPTMLILMLGGAAVLCLIINKLNEQ
jgi:hypothetical protein